MGKWLDCRARITSKELAQLHSVKPWHPPECSFYKSENGCRFGEKCSYAHRQVSEQPSKKFKKNRDRIAVAIFQNARQLSCELQDMEPPKSSSMSTEEFYHIETDPTCSIHQNRIAFCQHSRHQIVAWSNLPR